MLISLVVLSVVSAVCAGWKARSAIPTGFRGLEEPWLLFKTSGR